MMMWCNGMVCMYVYVYIYIFQDLRKTFHYVYIHMYIYIYMYTYTCNMYISIRIHICTHMICMYLLPFFPRSPSVYVYIYIYVSMYNICLSNTCGEYLSFECIFKIQADIYIYIHCITLHYITLHYITLQFDLLHCIASHHKHAYPPTYIQTDNIHSSIFRINIFGQSRTRLDFAADLSFFFWLSGLEWPVRGQNLW